MTLPEGAMGHAHEYLDRPPAGWFVLDVLRKNARTWVALMIDVHRDGLNNCACEFPALFYIDPKEYRPGQCQAQQLWLRIPGKHRDKDAAWDALENMMARGIEDSIGQTFRLPAAC
jgi:hypothetical protein